MEHPSQSQSQGRQHEKGVMERYEEEVEAEDHHRGDDYEDEDGEESDHHDVGAGEEDGASELPGSSFSYAPVPIEPSYNEEDDGDEMAISEDDEDDDNGSHYGGTQSNTTPKGHHHHSAPKAAAAAASTRGKGGSRRGRPYVPFSQAQAARFQEFLVDHPQIWSAATPVEGWVPEKVMREGKDATWKLLAAMPGVRQP